MNSKREFQGKLDPEEQELLASFEKGEWKSIDDVQAKKAEARKMAQGSMRQDAPINSGDVASIKQMAAYKGLSYQKEILQ